MKFGVAVLNYSDKEKVMDPSHCWKSEEYWKWQRKWQKLIDVKSEISVAAICTTVTIEPKSFARATISN